MIQVFTLSLVQAFWHKHEQTFLFWRVFNLRANTELTLLLFWPSPPLPSRSLSCLENDKWKFLHGRKSLELENQTEENINYKASHLRSGWAKGEGKRKRIKLVRTLISSLDSLSRSLFHAQFHRMSSRLWGCSLFAEQSTADSVFHQLLSNTAQLHMF